MQILSRHTCPLTNPMLLGIKNSVLNLYSFDPDLDPAFSAEYRSESGSNPDPEF